MIAVARSDGFQYLFPPDSFYQRSPTDYEDLRNSKQCQGFCGLEYSRRFNIIQHLRFPWNFFNRHGLLNLLVKASLY